MNGVDRTWVWGGARRRGLLRPRFNGCAWILLGLRPNRDSSRVLPIDTGSASGLLFSRDWGMTTDPYASYYSLSSVVLFCLEEPPSKVKKHFNERSHAAVALRANPIDVLHVTSHGVSLSPRILQHQVKT